jgi:hypothetical protein
MSERGKFDNKGILKALTRRRLHLRFFVFMNLYFQTNLILKKVSQLGLNLVFTLVNATFKFNNKLH